VSEGVAPDPPDPAASTSDDEGAESLRPPAVATSILRDGLIPVQIAEALRRMINRHELTHGAMPRTIAVTAASPAEGVTTVSQALGALIATETARRVCVVDFSWLTALDDEDDDDDADRPTALDILSDPLPSSMFWTPPDVPNLVMLSPGAVSERDANRIVRCQRFHHTLAALADEFDHVVFDLPPVLKHASTLSLVKLADASLLVVRHRRTSTAEVRNAISAMGPTPNLGVVVNRFRSRIPRRLRRLYAAAT
jgi:Mrp family chromosome partitioning ATPase